MFQTYDQVLTYLYEALPMYQRVGAAAFKEDIHNTVRLCAALGNPQHTFKTIHVAGTNGKGSSSHMLASVLQESGYKTGLYTSPHLKSFTERIKLNGNDVDSAFVVDFVNRIKSEIDEIKPSFFEITVAMAFEYFAQRKVDVAVIEVGLGGRLDSTNVILPEVSLITNISWDHKDILGDTLEKIAFEKAGIIKLHIPVVISERQDLISSVFVQKALTEDADLFFASDEFMCKPKQAGTKLTLDVYKNGVLIFQDLYIPLQGYYQQKNLLGVLKAVEILVKNGYAISNDNIIRGLEQVIVNTGLKGRWQKLGEKPLIICDTGHNLDGIRQVVDQINAQIFQKLHIVFGVVRDKDLTDILKVLPQHATYYFCEPKIPRAMKAELLADIAKSGGLTGVVIGDVNEALNEAKRRATESDMIFVGGSTFVVAEIEDL